MKKCPFCAEQIQDEAIKCRYCGEMLNGATPPPVLRPAPRAAAPVDPTTFSGALRSTFQQYSSATGRASRAEYWWYVLFVVLSLGVAGLLSQELAGLVLLVLIVPNVCAAIRRLHDVGQSGASLLWVFVPLLGNLYLLFLLASRGNPNPNPYGDPPAGSARDTTSWSKPEISREILLSIGGVVVFIALLAWLPSQLRESAVANRIRGMKDTIVAVGGAELRYKLAHGSYASDWEQLIAEFPIEVPEDLWVTLYASDNAFCAQVENQGANSPRERFLHTETFDAEQRDDGSIWVSWSPFECDARLVSRIGSSTEAPLPAIVDFSLPASTEMDVFVGRWSYDGPLRDRWLEVLEDGRFTYVVNAGSPLAEVITGTVLLSSGGRLALDLREGGLGEAAEPAATLTAVRFADVALGYGLMVQLEGAASCGPIDPTCVDLLTRTDAEMPYVEWLATDDYSYLDVGFPPVVSLHPAEAVEEEMYFGSWTSDTRNGRVELSIESNGRFRYAGDVTGTWWLNRDAGLLVLQPTEGDPASVALVSLNGGGFGLLFTADDCWSFDQSCGDLFTRVV